MIVLNAHFDGKVIIPDEPFNLPANQKLRISVEPVDTQAPALPDRVDFSDWLGLGLRSPQNPTPRFPDDDSLWEGTTGNHLENGPNKSHK